LAENAQEPVKEYSYYPGCSLHGTAVEFDASVRETAQRLGIGLIEVPDWNCCGASSAHMTDHELAVDLAARNLRIAGEAGRDLLVPCAACFHRLKAAQKELAGGSEGEAPGAGAVLPVHHIGDFLRGHEVLRKIRDAVKTPLQGLRLATYYGCLITRPPAVTGSAEHENPQSADLLVRVLGGEVVRWSYKTECCGGSLTMPRADITRTLVSRIVRAAARAGAEGIVTMCPMCQANLESRQLDLAKEEGGHPVLPVFYVTELIAACTADGRQPARWKPHLVDPAPLLASRGL